MDPNPSEVGRGQWPCFDLPHRTPYLGIGVTELNRGNEGLRRRSSRKEGNPWAALGIGARLKLEATHILHKTSYGVSTVLRIARISAAFMESLQ